MAKTARRDGPSSRQLGRHLKHIRRKQGLSRAEVARSAGLTRRELSAYERGRVDVPESDLWCLAGSCGVDVSELLPSRDPLRVSSDLSSLAVGDSIRHLRGPSEPDGLLREYLSMIYELRNLPPGSRVPLREPDLMALADALGGSPDAIEQKLTEMIGASREEAARLRAMILPPLSLPAAFDTPPPPTGDPYSTLGAPGTADGVVDFFSAPRAEDPFAPPPPLVSSGPTASEPLDVLPADPFAPPPSSAPIAAGPAPAEPVLVPPLVDPFASAATDAAMDAPWGADRVLPDGLVVDHGVPEAPPVPPDPFAAPERLVVPEPVVVPDPVVLPDPATGLLGPSEPVVPQLDTFVPDPEPFGVAHGNGHHDASALVDAEATDDELAPPDPLDGFMSDTPLLAESTLLDGPGLDGPGLDEVIAEMVGATVAEPASDPGPEPPTDAALEPVAEGLLPEDLRPEDLLPEDLLPEDLVAERPDTGDRFVVDAAPVPDEDVTPISWVAHEKPAAPPAPPPRFEQVGANWRVGGITAAAAAADDGALAIRRADARWAVADIEAPGDFTIDATVDFTAGTGFGILFRASVDAERISGYSFDVDSIAAGGGYLLRQWEDNRQHWRPLAHAPVADPSRLYGRRAVQVTVHGDHLHAMVDGETVLSVPGLSRASVALGRTPCRGSAVGVQASATTEMTVDTFRIAR